MRLSVIGCSLAAVLLPVGLALAQEAEPRTPAEKIVAGLRRDYQSPGVQFAAAINGQFVDTRSFGFAEHRRAAPVSDASLFAIASCSKSFTAMAMMKVISDSNGQITLKTKAFEYLGLLDSSTDPRFAEITIEQLLTHSSGLVNNVRAESPDPLDVAKKAVAETRLASGSKPGGQYIYSNIGFNVVGALISKASGGMSYRKYVQENVFKPAGASAVASALGQIIPGQVKQYNKEGIAVENTIPESGTPAGGWVMSATDIVKVLIAFDAGTIVPKDIAKKMFRPPIPPLEPRSNGAYYGLGWDLVYHDPSGGLVYGKNGGFDGAYCWMEHDANGADFALLFNGGTSGQDAQWDAAKPIERALANQASGAKK